MTEYDNNNSGALFKNSRKRPDKKDPDYQGQCEIDRKKFWISAWITESKKDGSKFMSLRFKPQEARAARPTENQSAPQTESFDDDISF